MICREVLQTGMGSSKTYAISLPERVNPTVLGLILDYCRFHQVPGRSNKERKSFDEKFIRTDVDQLCELASAADSLLRRPLDDITSRALARFIEGKIPEEIRETFHLPDDLTEDVDVQDEREELADERSVDDLLSFINGRDGDSKCVRPSKHKKKNRRRNEPKATSKIDHQKTNQKVENTQSPVCNESGNSFSCSPSRSSEMDGSAKDAFSVEFEFEDDNIDNDLDTAIKEELDREVEEFARSLNSDWLSIGERQLVPVMMNGNGSLRKYTGLALGDRFRGDRFRACSWRQINGCSTESGNGSPSKYADDADR